MIVEELIEKLGLEIDEGAFAKAEGILEKLHIGLGTALEAAAGAAAVGLAALAKTTADAAMASSRLAQTTGLDLETVQQFGFAAEASGIAVDDMAIALRHLAKTGVKDIGAEMDRLAEKFAGMPDDGNKVALAMAKFGRAGAAMIPLLNKGKEGVAALKEEAIELGYVFNAEDVAAAKDFKKSIHEIEIIFAAISRDTGRAILPYVAKAAKAVAHLLKDIRTGAEWVKKLTVYLKLFAVVLGGVVLAAILLNIAEIATLVSWYVALGIASMVAGLKAAAAWLMAAAPMIALGVAIALTILLMEDLYRALQGQKSLIAELAPLWTSFLDEILKHEDKEPFWLWTLKEGLSFLTHMEEALDSLMKKMGLSGLYVKAEVATPDEIAAFTARRHAFEAAQQANAPAPFFAGGASTPMAAASNASGATWGASTPGSGVLAPQAVNVTVKVVEDTEHFKTTVRGEINDHHDARMRDAGASVQ